MPELIDYDVEIKYIDGVTYRERVSCTDIFTASYETVRIYARHQSIGHGPVIQTTITRVD